MADVLRMKREQIERDLEKKKKVEIEEPDFERDEDDDPDSVENRKKRL